MTTPEPEHLVPIQSDRGFLRLPEIASTDGGTARVYESSAASGPHIWLTCEPGLAFKAPEYGKAPCHLTLDNARKLAEQILWLVDHHHQDVPRESA